MIVSATGPSRTASRRHFQIFIGPSAAHLSIGYNRRGVNDRFPPRRRHSRPDQTRWPLATHLRTRTALGIINAMKWALAFVAPLLLQACHRGEDQTAAAKQCVTENLGARKLGSLITASDRAIIARRCNWAIRNWAFISTKRSFGADFDVHDPRVRRAYRDRKLGIQRVLMPVAGDPMME